MDQVSATSRTASAPRPASSLAGLRVWLRPLKFEHRNRADPSSLACVLGKARVAPRLLAIDAVAFSAGQFADGHHVCLGSAFDTPVTGGGQVVIASPGWWVLQPWLRRRRPMSGSVSCGRYLTGLTYSRPLLRLIAIEGVVGV